jgi:hypothetical protein
MWCRMRCQKYCLASLQIDLKAGSISLLPVSLSGSEEVLFSAVLRSMKKKGPSITLDPFAWLNAPETGDLPLKGGYLPNSLELVLLTDSSVNELSQQGLSTAETDYSVTEFVICKTLFCYFSLVFLNNCNGALVPSAEPSGECFSRAESACSQLFYRTQKVTGWFGCVFGLAVQHHLL